jgi:predicted RNase H-like HicB family nuclease
MRVRFTAAVTQEDDWYVARCLEVEVTSQGRTVESAVAHLREAPALYLEDASLQEVPPSPILAPLEVEVPARRPQRRPRRSPPPAPHSDAGTGA